MGPRYFLPFLLPPFLFCLFLKIKTKLEDDVQSGLKVTDLPNSNFWFNSWILSKIVTSNDYQIHVWKLLVMGSLTSRTKPSFYIVIQLIIILHFQSSFIPLGTLKSKYNPSFTSQVSLFDMALCTEIKGVFIIQSFTNYVPENSAARMCSMKKVVCCQRSLLLIKHIGYIQW